MVSPFRRADDMPSSPPAAASPAEATGLTAPLEPTWAERLVASPATRSAYASLVAHVVVGILLAVLVLPQRVPPAPRPLVLGTATAVDPLDGLDAPAAIDLGDPGADAAAVGDALPAPELEAQAPFADPTDDAAPPWDDAPPEAIAESAAADGAGTRATTVAARAARPPAADAVAGYAARRGAGRGVAGEGRGASAGSEAAVERGLAWLALHQAADGSWRFDLSGCRCDGACRDHGTLGSTTASTAIALLPFLGAGSTHVDGRHQETVSRGIYYLLSRMQSTPRGGDFSEGTMYGHGIATLVLCEALGMTGDDLLRKPCRDAVRFIETAQDLHGGGWRYLPGQAGDITVTAWQLAALRSAQAAGVETSSPSFEAARRFLDSLASHDGAAYGYRTRAAKPCTSAIGLLCRMYTGWPEEEEALDRGIRALARTPPKPNAIYQNFYLAQALVQTDHPLWPRWNARQRDQLVALQVRTGHETGSWFFADPETAAGGRLAHTALAVLSLEVYYRLLPIYRAEAVSGSP